MLTSAALSVTFTAVFSAVFSSAGAFTTGLGKSDTSNNPGSMPIECAITSDTIYTTGK